MATGKAHFRNPNEESKHEFRQRAYRKALWIAAVDRHISIGNIKKNPLLSGGGDLINHPVTDII